MDTCVIFCAGGFEKLARQPDETDYILAANGHERCWSPAILTGWMKNLSWHF